MTDESRSINDHQPTCDVNEQLKKEETESEEKFKMSKMHGTTGRM